MKATFPDGTLFEGTTDEYLAIRGHVSVGASKNGAKATDVSGVWTEKKARHFWDSLDPRHNGGDQKKLLRFLMDNGGKAHEDEVRKHLGTKKGQELAGILANLSRNARREAKDDDVKAVVRTYQNGDRIYSIPQDLLQFLKQC